MGRDGGPYDGGRVVAPAAAQRAGSPVLTSKLAGFGTTIFAEMSALAVATGSVNLGQGFPDTDGPPRCSTRPSPRSAAA